MLFLLHRQLKIVNLLCLAEKRVNVGMANANFSMFQFCWLQAKIVQIQIHIIWRYRRYRCCWVVPCHRSKMEFNEVNQLMVCRLNFHVCIVFTVRWFSKFNFQCDNAHQLKVNTYKLRHTLFAFNLLLFCYLNTVFIVIFVYRKSSISFYRNWFGPKNFVHRLRHRALPSKLENFHIIESMMKDRSSEQARRR